MTLSQYEGEHQLQGIIDLISLDLSEPYSIFTYRYFINNWPQLCYVAMQQQGEAGSPPTVVGVIVCKQDVHRGGPLRGYIAMLAVRFPVHRRAQAAPHARAPRPPGAP